LLGEISKVLLQARGYELVMFPSKGKVRGPKHFRMGEDKAKGYDLHESNTVELIGIAFLLFHMCKMRGKICRAGLSIDSASPLLSRHLGDLFGGANP